jgi:hypothetical protein
MPSRRYRPGLCASSSAAVQVQRVENGNEELARRREGEVATRQLHDQRVPELGAFAEIRERIGGPSLSFFPARELEQQVGLANEVERDVRKRDVLFEDWPVAAPFGETMAVYQAIVT